MKTYDIYIGTQGDIRVMTGGFFEKVAKISMNGYRESDYTTFRVGNILYRVHTSEYELRKDKFERFFNRCQR